MRFRKLLIGFFLSTFCFSVMQANNTLSDKLKLPLSFIPNVGQSESAVRFQARGLGGTLFFTPQDITLSLPASKADTSTLRLRFEGANAAPEITGADVLPGVANYFRGRDPSGWKTDVQTYSSLIYHDLYPGIDLRYDGADGLLKGTYHVAPGADPSQIGWRYDGAEAERLEGGELRVTLPGGNTLAERAPVAWQDIDGQHVPVEIAYALGADSLVQFKLGTYDPAYPLELDPTLVYSTYLGGSSVENGYDIAVDNNGNAYIVGSTESTNFPTSSPYQNTVGDQRDVYITKLNAAGTSVVYSTYLGGSDYDDAYSIALDANSNVYIVGFTSSANFPIANAYQNTFKSGDAFITKLNSSGNALLYSTYLGGTGNDGAAAVAVDATGNAYVVGNTYSTDFPTVNPVQTNHDNTPCSYNGCFDAFVTKFSADGQSLVYSTYLGGNNQDWALGVALDTSNNAYITGFTESSNFPTLNAYQAARSNPTCTPSNSTSCKDAFVTKINSTGNALIYSTYLGGDKDERTFDIAMDDQGSAYVTGTTQSSGFPATTSYPPSSPYEDSAFLTKFSPDGKTLVYSLKLGDSDGSGIVVDAFRRPYLSGYTYNAALPTVNPVQATKSGFTDNFVLALNSTGSQVLFGTYLGGSQEEGDDFEPRIALDRSGNVYLSGITTSVDFPTLNAYQSLPGGMDRDGYQNLDATVSKIAVGLFSSFTVTSTADPGDGVCDNVCTLREAINAASANPGSTITFNIAGNGVHVISPLTPLPQLHVPIIIDGTTQPGYSGTPLIAIDGANTVPDSNIPTVNGQHIDLVGINMVGCTGCVVKGLNIRNFGYGGVGIVPLINPLTQAVISPAANNVVQSSYIGTDETGATAMPNLYGVIITNATDNQIGGQTAGQGNLISGNTNDGVNIYGGNATGNKVEGNRIGTNAAGTALLGNSDKGIKIELSGSTLVSGNIIAGSGSTGIFIKAGGTGNNLVNNRIYSNGGLGIDLTSSTASNAPPDDVTVNDAGDGDTGPNNLQNFPVLTRAFVDATTITLDGTLNSVASTDYQLQFFTSASCDPSGYGEGETVLGSHTVTTDGGGNASFSFTLNVAVAKTQFITATATDANGNTSEFSACRKVTYQPASILTVNSTTDPGDGVCDTTCTLRDAISEANLLPDANTITFSIPGAGVHSIQPTTQLPTLTSPVIIDGTTQPGYAGKPLIELRGADGSFTPANGLVITGGTSTVKGMAINRFGDSGITFSGAGGNTVTASFIGTNPDGSVAPGGGFLGGIVIDNVPNNIIGGTSAGAGNLISGNNNGVVIQGANASGNQVLGNRIGTNAAGVAALPNANDGILIRNSAHDNGIGGTSAGAGNLISGNSRSGILLAANATANRVEGNRIGTDSTGTAAIGNGTAASGTTNNNGIETDATASGNTIGGTNPASQNVISGNAKTGVWLNSQNNAVRGNLIGVNKNGTDALPNQEFGITTMGGGNSIIANVISGNGQGGISLYSNNNTVQGNFIGTDAAGTLNLKNTVVGIDVGGSSNTIGGTSTGQGNTIAYNGNNPSAPGVGVQPSAIGNRINGNRIFGNAGLGIDLLPGGVTPNDAGDVDHGANELQNFPVLAAAEVANGSLTVSGTLNSNASKTYRIEFFDNATCNPTGYGDGERYVGFADVLTDGSGNTAINVTLPVTVPDGHFITATATDPQGNTSEFSACVPAQAIDFSQVPARNYFTSTDVRLTWKGVNWASSYQIQIATDKDFKHILEPGIEVGAGSPYYAWTAPGDGTYYWHVRAKNAQGGVSLWSAVDSFVVDVP